MELSTPGNTPRPVTSTIISRLGRHPLVTFSSHRASSLSWLYDALGGHRCRGRIFQALRFSHGAGNGVLRLSRDLDFIPARSKVSSRTMGISGGCWVFGLPVLLPVYMYFNPSWSHAHSAFIVALFVWYWDRTRTTRTFRAMGASRVDRRAYDGCLLSECDPAFVSDTGIAEPFSEGFDPARSRIRSAAYFWITWFLPEQHCLRFFQRSSPRKSFTEVI